MTQDGLELTLLLPSQTGITTHADFFFTLGWHKSGMYSIETIFHNLNFDVFPSWQHAA